MQEIERLREQGWLTMAEWVDQADLRRMNERFDQLLAQNAFRPARVGRAESLRQHDWRTDQICWLDPEQPSSLVAPVTTRIQELRQELNRQLFLGLKDWEAHFALYAPGAHYKRHVDRHRDESFRKVSLILYLNQSWQPSDGGELVLYRGEDELARILPEPGRMVMFLSEEFPHEVLPAQRPRRSLTGWFLDHVKEVL